MYMEGHLYASGRRVAVFSRPHIAAEKSSWGSASRCNPTGVLGAGPEVFEICTSQHRINTSNNENGNVFHEVLPSQNSHTQSS